MVGVNVNMNPDTSRYWSERRSSAKGLRFSISAAAVPMKKPWTRHSSSSRTKRIASVLRQIESDVEPSPSTKSGIVETRRGRKVKKRSNCKMHMLIRQKPRSHHRPYSDCLSLSGCRELFMGDQFIKRACASRTSSTSCFTIDPAIRQQRSNVSQSYHNIPRTDSLATTAQESTSPVIVVQPSQKRARDAGERATAHSSRT
mmetsp:Transcript_31689/g.97004  ORF Transcript_31689/g.97004 Transcript_31689/m.97004 type:complete len:201 (+) Transcript_31689:723-1325(+)|eukprot:scaffold117575_cov32-Tisochrysis_lutea.AAC.1